MREVFFLFFLFFFPREKAAVVPLIGAPLPNLRENEGAEGLNVGGEGVVGLKTAAKGVGASRIEGIGGGVGLTGRGTIRAHRGERMKRVLGRGERLSLHLIAPGWLFLF